MRVIGMAKVGAVVAVLSAAAAAETIPYDYWYGRIIGRTRIQTVQEAYNGESGAVRTSLSTGYRNQVGVNLGTLLTITEGTQGNDLNLNFVRPKLSSVAQLSPRTRWTITRIDWQDGSDSHWSGPRFYYRSSSIFLADQRFSTLGHEVEYDADKSLYMYLDGIWLGKGNWSLDAGLGTVFDDGTTWFRDTTAAEPDHIRTALSDNDRTIRQWDTWAVCSYGISDRLQISPRLSYERLTDEQQTLELFAGGEQGGSVPGRYELIIDRTDRLYGVGGRVQFLLAPSHWLELTPLYQSGRDHSVVGDQSIGYDETTERERQDLSSERNYSLNLEHTWVSRDNLIPVGRLLDDHRDYYGHRLDPGTISVRSSAQLSLRRAEVSSVIYPGTPRENRYASRGRSNALGLTSELTYYSPLGIDVNLSLGLSRRSSGSSHRSTIDNYSHNQSYYYSLSLNYFSYRWDPAKRRNIGWDQIEDIDYLLGPLLQLLDWKASFIIIPPASNWSARYAEENIFNFFKGESDDHWRGTFAGAIGLGAGLEMGLDVSFDQSVSNYTSDAQSQRSVTNGWSVHPTLKWQPGSRFRTDVALTETYRDYQVAYSYGRDSDYYTHTWQLLINYTILI